MSAMASSDALHLQLSSSATGSRECAPDDRLQRTSQYSRDAGDEMDRPRRTGSPACAGDDDGGRGELLPVIARSTCDEAIQPSPFAVTWIASLTLAMTLLQPGLLF